MTDFRNNSFFNWVHKHQNKYVLILLVIVTFLSFWKKGQYNLQEWDESRNGINACEMLQNKDFVNLFYQGQVDTWNSKPPLMIWMIAGSYKLFGFNEFALRFPLALCSIAFFLLCFYTIKLLESELTAFLTCLILLSSKAILGNHVALTADFDGPLIVFLTASVYFFILYMERQKKYSILLVGIFTGLAFYTKGPASLVLIPGFLFYILFRKHLKILKDPRLWLSVLIFMLIAGSWLAISSKYGKTMQNSHYSSKNSIETMLIYDTFHRLTNSNFDHIDRSDRNYAFVLEVLDARLNLWNYVFELGLLIGIYFLFKQRRHFFSFINNTSNRMILLSCCLIFPLSIILTFATSKNFWYLAPIFMFIAFITVKVLQFFAKKWRLYVYCISAGLLAFTFGRQVFYILTLPTDIHQQLTNKTVLKNKTVYFTTDPKQDILLYFKWLNITLVKKESITEIPNQPGTLFFLDCKQIKESLHNNATVLAKLEDFCLAEIKTPSTSLDSKIPTPGLLCITYKKEREN